MTYSPVNLRSPERQQRVTFLPSSKQVFDEEKFDVLDLCAVLSVSIENDQKTIDKFSSRIFAYLALYNLILDILPNRPWLVSTGIKHTDDRCAETYGWRVIFKASYEEKILKQITIKYIDRIHDYKQAPLRDTLKKCESPQK